MDLWSLEKQQHTNRKGQVRARSQQSILLSLCGGTNSFITEYISLWCIMLIESFRIAAALCVIDLSGGLWAYGKFKMNEYAISYQITRSLSDPRLYRSRWDNPSRFKFKENAVFSEIMENSRKLTFRSPWDANTRPTAFWWFFVDVFINKVEYLKSRMIFYIQMWFYYDLWLFHSLNINKFGEKYAMSS